MITSLNFYFENHWLMLIAAFLTSVVSGTIGVAGGILLLTFMAPHFPATVLIPLHGMVQLASNLARVTLNFNVIDRKIVRLFILGSLFGAAVGSRVVVRLPEGEYKLLLGIFILVMTWIPEFKKSPKVRGKFIYLGAATTFLSLVIGAVGPLIAPFFIREGLAKERLVVTKAACQATVHALKVSVFIYLGFELGTYFSLFVGMVLAVAIGNYLGKHLLGKIPEKLFIRVFKVVISVLAVQMVYRALIT